MKFVAMPVVGLILWAAGSPRAFGQASPDPLPPRAWLLPFEFTVTFNPKTQQAAYYDFMWQSFIALSWPAKKDGLRGQPDASQSILDVKGGGPLPAAVWETYREPFEIFIPPDQFKHYPNWNDPRRLPPGVPPGSKVLTRFAKIGPDFTTDINQPDFFVFGPTGPLIDQNRNYARYEVAVNQAYFTYIKRFRYFDSAEQIKAVRAYINNPNDPKGFQLPPTGTEGYVQKLRPFARQGLVEVKAAWRVLVEGKDDFSRYFHRPVIPLNVHGKPGKPLPMGLVALHILRFTPNGRVASTFEQVDNVAVGRDAPPGLQPSFNTGAPPTPLQARVGFEGRIPAPITKKNPPKKNPKPVSIYRVAPIPEAVQAANRKYQAMLGDSVFSFYQLVNTQNRHPGDDFSNPERNGHQGPITGVYTNANNLINTALESYTQTNYSCIQCHIWARPLGVGPEARELDHFKILSFLLRNAQPSPRP